MPNRADISPAIVETLYFDALALADEAREAFDMSGRLDDLAQSEELARIALSCEALRTTTRMMHALAWLLNHRAYFAGEMSEFQLRRHGRLPTARPDNDPDQLALLDPYLQELVARSKRFYARIARLDYAWRDRFTMHPAAVHRLRDRVNQAMNSL